MRVPTTTETGPDFQLQKDSAKGRTNDRTLKRTGPSAGGCTTAITKSGTTTNFTYAGGDQSTRTTANNIGAALSSLGTDIEASTGSVYHFYIRDPSGNLLAIVNDNAGTLTTRYPILDGIGSVIGLTNGTGTVDDTTKYDPYGIVLSHTGTDYNPFGYASGYTDSTTGLIHFGARYDNPADGRFTQQDPSGQEANLYAYAGDNPTNFVDPAGLGSVFGDIAGAVAGFVAGAACGYGGLICGTAVGAGVTALVNGQNPFTAAAKGALVGLAATVIVYAAILVVVVIFL